MEYLLRRAIDEVYRQHELHSSPIGTPLFEEVRIARREESTPMGRVALWKASTMRVLESLCFPHGLGPVVNSQQTLDPKQFLNTAIVLEIDALADADKIFLTEALILWIYEYRKHQPQREEFQHALVIEEAHHILSEQKERSSGAETIMETCLRQIREFGESVIVIDQEPSKLSHSIKANTATKISFRLGTSDDAEEVANDHGLDEEERRSLDLLQIGKAIVSVAHRIPRAIHVSFPLVPIAKGHTGNTQVRHQYKKLG